MTLKDFTKKVRIAATKTVATLKEMAPFFGIGVIGGMFIGGYVNTCRNSNDIKRLNNRVNNLGDAVNNLGDVVNNNADASIRDHERIDTLEKRQALLMEQALRITEGKTEE